MGHRTCSKQEIESVTVFPNYSPYGCICMRRYIPAQWDSSARTGNKCEKNFNVYSNNLLFIAVASSLFSSPGDSSAGRRMGNEYEKNSMNPQTISNFNAVACGAAFSPLGEGKGGGKTSMRPEKEGKIRV